MTEQIIRQIATEFRAAIEVAKDAGEFKPPKPYQREPMDNFPYDCCDDTADLFIHYLYHTFEIDSIKVTGSYYSKRLKCTCFHTWQEFEGWVIDLTGDQFDRDSDIKVKTIPVYVDRMDEFHRQFENPKSEHSCGIECLGAGCHERMYGLYDKIMTHMNVNSSRT